MIYIFHDILFASSCGLYCLYWKQCCVCGIFGYFLTDPNLCDVPASHVLPVYLFVLHYSGRNVTFHYRRSSTAYFGGMCSVSRGVGVNEVRFSDKHPVSLCAFITALLQRAKSLVFVVHTVRRHLGHGRLPHSEPGAEPGHPVGPGIQEKYTSDISARLEQRGSGGRPFKSKLTQDSRHINNK